MIDHIAWTCAGCFARRWAGIGFTKLICRRVAAFDSPARIALEIGRCVVVTGVCCGRQNRKCEAQGQCGADAVRKRAHMCPPNAERLQAKNYRCPADRCGELGQGKPDILPCLARVANTGLHAGFGSAIALATEGADNSYPWPVFDIAFDGLYHLDRVYLRIGEGRMVAAHDHELRGVTAATAPRLVQHPEYLASGKFILGDFMPVERGSQWVLLAIAEAFRRSCHRRQRAILHMLGPNPSGRFYGNCWQGLTPLFQCDGSMFHGKLFGIRNISTPYVLGVGRGRVLIRGI